MSASMILSSILREIQPPVQRTHTAGAPNCASLTTSSLTLTRKMTERRISTPCHYCLSHSEIKMPCSNTMKQLNKLSPASPCSTLACTCTMPVCSKPNPRSRRLMPLDWYSKWPLLTRKPRLKGYTTSTFGRSKCCDE